MSLWHLASKGLVALGPASFYVIGPSGKHNARQEKLPSLMRDRGHSDLTHSVFFFWRGGGGLRDRGVCHIHVVSEAVPFQ